MTTSKPIHFVAFADGSCLQNPGAAGFGVYGYVFQDAERPKNVKLPAHPTLYFTSTGISKEKEQRAIEVTRVVEVIKAINNTASTNNSAEILAFYTVLLKASEMQNLASLTIYTDSNYVVSSFNENIEKWKRNGFRRTDGNPVAHISDWLNIDELRNKLQANGVQIKAAWVKGHSEDHGNIMADLYSVVASNSTKRQLQRTDGFDEWILDSNITYKEYKDSYGTKDIMFFFRDLYFNSNPTNDTHYCFLSTSETPNTVGKRDTSSIFVTNIGYVPPLINRLKEIYRNISRNYSAVCCMKLSKLENKELYRLASLIDPQDLLVQQPDRNKVTYKLVRDTTPFIFENTVDYPFIVNASQLFTNTLDISEFSKDDKNIIVKDITSRIVQDGKIAFTNKDKHLDFTDIISDQVTLKQKLIATVGYDLPSFLALKNIEDIITKVDLILNVKTDSNFCTMYINIQTSDRSLYSVNIENKFLRQLTSPIVLKKD